MKAIMWVLAVGLWPFFACAQKKPSEAAKFKSVEIQGEAKPGSAVTLLITIMVEKGYHTHSHLPSEKQFIPTVLSLALPSGVELGAIQYPAGKSERVQGLPKPLSIYKNEFQITASLKLGSEARLPLTIPATLSYQACQGAVCFPPQKLKFDLAVPSPK